MALPYHKSYPCSCLLTKGLHLYLGKIYQGASFFARSAERAEPGSHKHKLLNPSFSLDLYCLFSFQDLEMFAASSTLVIKYLDTLFHRWTLMIEFLKGDIPQYPHSWGSFTPIIVLTNAEIIS